MPPFIGQPEGFSSGALELLDDALTKLWLEQVAIGATMSGLKPDAIEKLLQAERTRPSQSRGAQSRSSQRRVSEKA
jgi:hypothetical protein